MQARWCQPTQDFGSMIAFRSGLHMCSQKSGVVNQAIWRSFQTRNPTAYAVRRNI